MSSKLACKADVCYNLSRNIVVLGGAGNTPSWINLFWRLIVNTLPPHADHGNTPLRQCKSCPEGQQWHPATLEYFPPEKKGKYGLSSYCRVCARVKQKKHRNKPEKHEHHLAYMKEYHQRPEVQEKQRTYNHLPETKARARAHQNEYHRRPGAKERAHAYHQRPEVKARMRAFYAQPEQKARRSAYVKSYLSRPEIRTQRNAYQQEYNNLPEVQSRKRAWSLEYWKRPRTRALYQATRQRRRALLHTAVGTHTPEQIQEQYNRQKGHCYYCRKKVALDEYHIDHVIPLSRGGSNDISNIVIACAACNLSKRDKLPHEFFKGGRLF